MHAPSADLPHVLDYFVSARRVRVPFQLDPVAACLEPLWLTRQAAAAFLCAVADAACDRSQSCSPLHVLPPALALRRPRHPLSAPASPVVSHVTLDAPTGPSGSASDEVWLAPAPPAGYPRLFLSASRGAVADAPGEPG